jgi:hypothetical protein
VPACWSPRDEVGEELGHELPARLALPLSEGQVLGDGELREHLAVFRHVADAAAHDAVRRQSVDALAAEADLAAARDETEDAPQRGGLADAVASQDRGDAGGGDVE